MSRSVLYAAVVTSFSALQPATAATLGSDFTGLFSIADLGTPPGVPGPLGGLTLQDGDDDTLLIGGGANTAAGRIHSVGVTRDASGSIDGFDGSATPLGFGSYNDGGVTFGPTGVLFLARWNINELGQVKPGSTTEDKVTDLGPFGIGGSSVSALGFVPSGFDNAGATKLVTWSSGQWWDLELAPDGSGTFDIDSVSRVDLDPGVAGIQNLSGGPEGFVYIKGGNPGFNNDSMLVSAFSANRVDAYEIDTNADPILSTRRTFISDLGGAEGAFIDPSTGDFLFSTFRGGNRVLSVSGFAPPPPPPPPSNVIPLPAAGWMLLGGLGLLVGLHRRRRS